MEARLTYKNGSSNHPTFEVMATIANSVPNWHDVFEDNVDISKLDFPIDNKPYRLVGLHGRVQKAFFKTFGKDMLFLENEKEIENALKQVIITMKYKVGQYNVVK